MSFVVVVWVVGHFSLCFVHKLFGFSLFLWVFALSFFAAGAGQTPAPNIIVEKEEGEEGEERE